MPYKFNVFTNRLDLTDTASSSGVSGIIGENGVNVYPLSGDVVVSGVNATTSSVGVASFDSSVFTVTSGSVTFSSSVSLFTWTVTNASPVTMADSTNYINNYNLLTTFALPSTCPVGSLIRIAGNIKIPSGSSFTITQNAGQMIWVFSLHSTLGATGGIHAQNTPGVCIELLCIVADTTFQVITNGEQALRVF